MIIEFRAPFQDANHDSLSHALRPVPGGMLIYWFRNSDNRYVPCTLGFNARDLGFPGTQFFVTASHCSNRRGGGAESTRFFQWDRATGNWLPIGTEVRDPVYFDQYADPDCPADANCRYSDALLVQYDSASIPEYARIARTTFSSRLNDGSLAISDDAPRFNIVGTYYYPVVGEVVEKIGYFSGWTWGGVREGAEPLNTCVRLPRSDPSVTNLTYLCQAVVDSRARPGDSGGPVFVWLGGNDVNVIGTVLGGDPNDPSVHYVFSPFGGILNDLGRDLYPQPI